MYCVSGNPLLHSSKNIKKNVDKAAAETQIFSEYLQDKSICFKIRFSLNINFALYYLK